MCTLGQVLAGGQRLGPSISSLALYLSLKTRSLVTLSQQVPHHLSQLLTPPFVAIPTRSHNQGSPDRSWGQPLAMDTASCLARRDLSHTVGQTHPSGGDSCTLSLSVNPGVKASLWLSEKPESRGLLHGTGPTAGEGHTLQVCRAIKSPRLHPFRQSWKRDIRGTSLEQEPYAGLLWGELP